MSARTDTPNWERLGAQLTTFAWRNTGQRSWELAQEIAQQAIAEYLERPEKWDPSQKTLLRHLGHEVLRIARNEIRRMRSSFEVAMDYDQLVEHEVDDGQPIASEVLEQKQLAARFAALLTARLAGDDEALVAVALLKEEIDTPLAQAKASGLSVDALRAARRRVFYQAERVNEELARELDGTEARP